MSPSGPVEHTRPEPGSKVIARGGREWRECDAISIYRRMSEKESKWETGVKRGGVNESMQNGKEEEKDSRHSIERQRAA